MSDISVSGSGSINVQYQRREEELAGLDQTQNTSRSRHAKDVEAKDTLPKLYGAFEKWLGKGGVKIDEPKTEPTVPGDPSAWSSKLDAAVSNLHVDICAVMKLMHEMARNARQAAREERQANLEMRMSSLSDAAQKLREAAAERWSAALVSGITQIGAGVAQGVGGFVQLRGASAAAATDKAGTAAGNVGSGATATAQAAQNSTAATGTVTDTAQTASKAANNVVADMVEDGARAAAQTAANTTQAGNDAAKAATTAAQAGGAAATGGDKAAKAAEAAEQAAKTGETATKTTAEALADPRMKVADGKSQMWLAAGQFMTGGGKLGEAHHQQEAALREAEKADADRVAELYENARQRADEQMKLMLDMINDIKSMMQSIESSRHETAKNIVRA